AWRPGPGPAPERDQRLRERRHAARGPREGDEPSRRGLDGAALLRRGAGAAPRRHRPYRAAAPHGAERAGRDGRGGEDRHPDAALPGERRPLLAALPPQPGPAAQEGGPAQPGAGAADEVPPRPPMGAADRGGPRPPRAGGRDRP